MTLKFHFKSVSRFSDLDKFYRLRKFITKDKANLHKINNKVNF